MGKKSGTDVKNKHLITHIVTIAMVGIVALAIALCIVSYTEFKNSYHEMGEEMLQASCIQLEKNVEDNYAGTWSLQDGVLYKGETNMEEAFGDYLMDLKKSTGQEFTMIYDKTRYITTIDGMKGKDISDKVYETVKTGKTFADFNTDINGKKYYVFYTPAMENGKYVGCFFSGRLADDINAQMRKKIILLAGITIVVTLLFVVIGVLLSLKYSKLMKAIADGVDVLASGDLNPALDDVLLERQDELGLIASSTKSLADKLREVVGHITDAAEIVGGQATDLASTAGQISETTDSVSQAVQDMAKGATDQADTIQSASENIATLSDAIQSVAENAEDLASTAATMNDTSSTSAGSLDKLSDNMKTMRTAMTEISQSIDDTNNAVAQINERVDGITSIAAQTNLLALNASIEAARAGDAGRGFAVVAEEIGKLASDSATMADEIRSVMQELVKTSQGAMSKSSEVQEISNNVTEVLGDTVNTIQHLIGGVTTTVDGIDNISGLTQECAANKTLIVDSMASLSAISEQNAASTEQTSASMQELNATINMLASSADNLNDIAQKLKDDLMFFRL
ncbi:MAG: methyl-accepting chemotaxis protein [Lachnospiraceae bacterium]|nr:methyl-accepting chemotaxis protein [Lachnospiraceae bacterium]